MNNTLTLLHSFTHSPAALPLVNPGVAGEVVGDVEGLLMVSYTNLASLGMTSVSVSDSKTKPCLGRVSRSTWGVLRGGRGGGGRGEGRGMGYIQIREMMIRAEPCPSRDDRKTSFMLF